MGYSRSTTNMKFLVFCTLASVAIAFPKYVHVDIPAEPYVHEEIPAEPYVHIEPEISPLALGIVRPGAQQQAAAPQQYQQPQQYQAQPQQQYYQQPHQPAGYASGPWQGQCYNNKGEGVECRRSSKQKREGRVLYIVISIGPG